MDTLVIFSYLEAVTSSFAFFLLFEDNSIILRSAFYHTGASCFMQFAAPRNDEKTPQITFISVKPNQMYRADCHHLQ